MFVAGVHIVEFGFYYTPANIGGFFLPCTIYHVSVFLLNCNVVRWGVDVTCNLSLSHYSTLSLTH